MAKRIIAKEVLLAYPDFSKPFQMHTDASHCQLGAVISQEGKPIGFYSRKLNPAQTRCTTTERELLSIVETLKEYRNILLGHEIEVFTDHQNLVYKTFNTERVMRWRLLIEEFGPKLTYIKGASNVVADKGISTCGFTAHLSATFVLLARRAFLDVLLHGLIKVPMIKVTLQRVLQSCSAFGMGHRLVIMLNNLR